MAITKYHIQIGDEDVVFEGPDGLTDRQIERLADSHLRHAKPGSRFPHSVYRGEIDPAPPDEIKSSTLGAIARNLTHDAYFNWDDELIAAANAGIPGSAAIDPLSPDQQSPSSGGKFWDRFHHNMEALKQQQV